MRTGRYTAGVLLEMGLNSLCIKSSDFCWKKTISPLTTVTSTTTTAATTAAAAAAAATAAAAAAATAKTRRDGSSYSTFKLAFTARCA